MNNFKEYGFEADFEGAILSDIEDYYIGYYVESYPCLKEKQKIPTFWNKNNGSCYKGAGVSNSKYTLKPIKKEWYENPDNFPCVVLDRNYNMYLAKGINIDNFLTQEFNRQIGYVEHFRPATKEEILSLLVKK